MSPLPAYSIKLTSFVLSRSMIILPSHYIALLLTQSSYRGLQSLRLAPSHESANEIALSQTSREITRGLKYSTRHPPFSVNPAADQFKYNLNLIPTWTAEELRLFEVIPSKSLLTVLKLSSLPIYWEQQTQEWNSFQSHLSSFSHWSSILRRLKLWMGRFKERTNALPIAGKCWRTK